MNQLSDLLVNLFVDDPVLLGLGGGSSNSSVVGLVNFKVKGRPGQ